MLYVSPATYRPPAAGGPDADTSCISYSSSSLYKLLSQAAPAPSVQAPNAPALSVLVLLLKLQLLPQVRLKLLKVPAVLTEAVLAPTAEGLG